jgi:hypothetical protein
MLVQRQLGQFDELACIDVVTVVVLQARLDQSRYASSVGTPVAAGWSP